MAPSLTVVPAHIALPTVPAAESLTGKIRRLQSEARAAATEQIRMLDEALAQVARLSGEVAEGGEAYTVGARELSRHLAQEAVARRKSLAILSGAH